MDKWALILSIPAMLGAILAFLGMRGRLVSADPHCRKCGYNLVGSPASPTCPECGAALAAPHAIRHGSRKRRPWVIALGLTLVLLSASVCGRATWQRLRNFNWYNYVPTAWLLHMDSSQAVAELVVRTGNHQLTPSQENLAVERALLRQGELTRPWNSNWGRIIEIAYESGLTTSDQVNKYVDQAFESPGLLRNSWWPGRRNAFCFYPRVGDADPEIRSVTFHFGDCDVSSHVSPGISPVFVNGRYSGCIAFFDIDPQETSPDKLPQDKQKGLVTIEYCLKNGMSKDVKPMPVRTVTLPCDRNLLP